MVASNLTDTSVGAVNLPHEGPEEYNNIYQKVRSMWAYAYDNYYEKYDWFHIGGDDLFLLMENLKLYLESEEILTAQNGGIYLPNGDERVQTPMFLGRRFAYQGDMDDIFNSGGSGYTLNKAAVKTLVVHGFPKFMPHAHTFSEDTMVARVLRKLGVHAYDTKDDQGGERYMPFLVRTRAGVLSRWIIHSIVRFRSFLLAGPPPRLRNAGRSEQRLVREVFHRHQNGSGSLFGPKCGVPLCQGRHYETNARHTLQNVPCTIGEYVFVTSYVHCYSSI